jgi:hypothetical protein
LGELKSYVSKWWRIRQKEYQQKECRPMFISTLPKKKKNIQSKKKENSKSKGQGFVWFCRESNDIDKITTLKV